MDHVGTGADDDMLDELGPAVGDAPYVTKHAGGIHLTPHDHDFEEVVKAGRDYMKRHHDASEELAR